MKLPFLLLCACLLGALPAFAQTRKPSPLKGTASSAAGICANPYQVQAPADGFAESPVVILFHHEDSKAPWTRNPAIRVPGVEAANPAAARTVVCVEESRLEVGRYDSGEPAYSPSWTVTLVRLADRKAYLARSGFEGEEPPGLKFHRGAGVGKPPIEKFTLWLRLLLNQKVARFKMKFPAKEYHTASALAFSADGSRLALAQEPRSSGSGGTPPTPLTVFDLASGKTVATLHADYIVRAIALSRSGKLLATERYGHPEIWDLESGKVTAKLETSGVESLMFGPNGAAGEEVLATSGKDTTTLWDVSNRRALSSGPGTHVTLSLDGKWIVAKKETKGFSVLELESGRTVSSFPAAGNPDSYAISRNGLAFVRYSVLGATMLIGAGAEPTGVRLPNLGVGVIYAIASTGNGFAVSNGDGFAGIISTTDTEPRAFATDHTAIHALAVSLDGKLLAIGDSSGNVSVWELR
jgi:WD40 domain-containing protein